MGKTIIFWILNAAIIFLILYFLYKKEKKSPLSIFFFPGLFLKIISGILVGLVYTYYYQNPNSDSFLYFHDAEILSRLLPQKIILFSRTVFLNDFSDDLVSQFKLYRQPRAFLLSKILSPIVFLSGNNYWLSGFYLSIFSFFGMWKLANVLAEKYPENKWGAGVSFLLFPSVVFWSSGVAKESVIMGSICLSLAFVFDRKQPKIKLKTAFVFLSVFLVAVLKYYYLGILLPVLTAYFLTENFKKIISQNWQKASMFFLLLLVILFTATLIHPNLYPANFFQALVKNHDIMLKASENEGVIKYMSLAPDFYSILKNVPLAFISGLFRPFIWEGKTVFQFFIGFENAILLGLTIYASYRILIGKLKISEQLLVIAAISYILLLAILLSLSSPNLGTLSRYKIAFEPFFIYLLSFSLVKKDNHLS